MARTPKPQENVSARYGQRGIRPVDQYAPGVPAKWSRLWFAATALCVVAGVAISVYTAVQTPGRFHSGIERAFNTFAFFTIQSNLIVGGTTLLLAARPDRSSAVFRVFRLIGLVAITVTGVVYHVALSRLVDLEGWHQLGNQLVHTVVPLLAVVGWLGFGPRRLTSARVAWLSLLFPACWIAFTLIRGAVWHWYPYPFIDVTVLGYGKVILNCFWVALLLLGLAAGATVLDRRLAGPAAGPTPLSAA
jgi:hypothetical protein